MFGVIVAMTVLAHFCFIGYVVAGGLLALRCPRTIALHVAAVLWALASAAGRVGCPLTGLERWTRHRAGMPPLPSQGFIAHYITGVLYPADAVTAVQVLVFAVIAMTWAGYLRGGRHRHSKVSGTDRPLSSSGGEL
jgi:hypothetical protein